MKKKKKKNKLAAVVIFSIYISIILASQVNAVDETKKIVLLFISHLIPLNHFIKIIWTWVYGYLFCYKNVQFKSPWDTSKNGLKCIQCNYSPYFGTHFLWDWNENWPFPIPWPLVSFPDLLAFSKFAFIIKYMQI